MQIILKKENLSEVDCGGGIRETTTIITIDSSLTPRRLREAAIHETLGALLDNDIEERHEFVDYLTRKLVDVLDQLEGL